MSNIYDNHSGFQVGDMIKLYGNGIFLGVVTNIYAHHIKIVWIFNDPTGASIIPARLPMTESYNIKYVMRYPERFKRLT